MITRSRLIPRWAAKSSPCAGRSRIGDMRYSLAHILIGEPVATSPGYALFVGVYPDGRTGGHPRIKSEGMLRRDMRYRFMKPSRMTLNEPSESVPSLESQSTS